MTTMTVRTKHGELLGKERPGYAAVLGIPYAAPPVGDLRFRPPQEPVPWDGVRDGTIFGPASLQPSTEYDPANGSEDCLYLNVYEPTGPSGPESLPVMVWLHGGGFVNGSGNAFFGGFLAQTAGAVIVTVNYRLGPLGWLALPSLAAESEDGNAGNYGLLDTIAALGWVRDNIAAFGGDPGRVTVFGQSAGAEQVLALLASPLTAGLLHRAISMSAPAGLTLPDLDAAAARNTGFLQRMGCEDTGAQLSLLRGASAQSLVNAAQMSWDLVAAGGIPFTPTVGGGVLPGQWLDLFRQGKFHHVPVMIGHTKQEGRLFTAIHENNLGRRVTSEDLTGRLVASGLFPEPLIKEVARKYELDSTPDIGGALADTLVDSLWAAGLEKCRAALARETTVYSYQTFDPDAPESHVHAQFSTIGAGHDSDLSELFQWDDFTSEPPRLSAEQQRYAVQLGRYWGQFAATGDPNGAGLPTWRPMNEGYVQYLETDRTGGTRSVTNAEYQEDHKYRFWSPIINPEPDAVRPGRGHGKAA
jgi:para-nitrobenzyl esterase